MRRLNVKTLEFVPYGVVEDGSAARARYARHLQGYLAALLRPVLAGWEGELPEHLQKARPALAALARAPALACTESRLCGWPQGTAL